ncbi:FkbM family methyltransferase [Stenomitos frigidus]|uniref:FkbM family methyltransferase n=1 Tax=Stenomitos frigidus ULC18 TaxID=2107698 RepID=A0A2T1ELH8_9CYAN|nr:FkbM family methyltransferase [Stenomitos frigidus]PSB33599.1 FkbM family methyltransferase [Stenomitos frigidus ULC18]
MPPPSDRYWQYLEDTCPSIAPTALPLIHSALAATRWDEPQSPLDWNNYGVVALIEAEDTTDRDLRRLYVEAAIAAFENGVNAHPLCAAHLALTYSLIGETDRAGTIATTAFIRILQPLHDKAATVPIGLIYLPSSAQRLAKGQDEAVALIVQLDNGLQQALFLLGTLLGQQLLPAFYNPNGLRLLNLATQILPSSAVNNLTLGIANLANGLWEGLFYLHRAEQLAPNEADVLQALYLAYRDLGHTTTARYWLETARVRCPVIDSKRAWQWVDTAIDQAFTCIPFKDLLLTVKPSLASITTGVLLAKGDWFEAEMEFWRHHIQPGMTVIDVGANVGVYTFSAAQRVGNQGRVLAIEPFSECVQFLQETCNVNQLSWVKVIAGAASDRTQTAQLALQMASELNQLVPNDAELVSGGNVETVACFTLDALIEQESIAHVDFLKIDAEGHELQVLAGSERLLTKLMPTIVYENIASDDQANTSSAVFLQERGYQLFRYQPYLQELIAVSELDELQMSLNVIAIHTSNL